MSKQDPVRAVGIKGFYENTIYIIRYYYSFQNILFKLILLNCFLLYVPQSYICIWPEFKFDALGVFLMWHRRVYK